MNRVQLDQLTVEVARQHRLDAAGVRATLLDRIIDHFVREGWPEQFRATVANPTENAMPNTSNATQGNAAEENRSLLEVGQDEELARQEGSGRDSIFPGSSQMPNFGEPARSPTQANEEARYLRSVNFSAYPSTLGRGYSASPEFVTITQQNWNRIYFTTKLIPSFSGKDNENLVNWIDRISTIARMYQIPNESLLLAVVSQLQDRALSWYNRQPIETVMNWKEFKFQIRRYFERKESLTTTLAKINSRIWKTHTERFVEYA